VQVDRGPLDQLHRGLRRTLAERALALQFPGFERSTAQPRPRDVQVHVVASGEAFEREHLLFRDYLRAHQEACLVYAALKMELAARWRDDRYAYVDAKTKFILDTLELTEAWASLVGWPNGPPSRDIGRPPDQGARS